MWRALGKGCGDLVKRSEVEYLASRLFSFVDPGETGRQILRPVPAGY
jgi:hypothetical protein